MKLNILFIIFFLQTTLFSKKSTAKKTLKKNRKSKEVYIVLKSFPRGE
jgi:hypothetical protein